MGYYFTAEPENAVPPNSCATPKTHTPGSPVKERGHRYYQPEIGRWCSRDPILEVGSVTWLQKQNVIRKMREVLRSRGVDSRFENLLMDALIKNQGMNVYLMCANDSIDKSDLLGELSCIMKGLQLASIEIQMISVQAAMTFTGLAIPGVLANILLQQSLKAIPEAAVFVAEQNLQMCLAAQLIDHCRDCSYEQLLVDGLQNTVAGFDAVIAQLQSDLNALYSTMLLLTQQLGTLAGQADALIATPCSWP